MVGMFDVAHCGNCGSCIPSCVVFDPNKPNYHDNFTTLFGVWNEGFNAGIPYHEVDGSSPVYVLVNDNPTDVGLPWAAFSEFEVTPNGAGLCIWRLFGGGLDTNNHLFVEFRLEPIGDGNYYFNMKIGEVVGGLTYYWAFKYYNDQDYIINPLDKKHFVYLYYDWESTLTGFDTAIKANGSLENWHTISKRAMTCLGTFSGVHVLTMNGTLRISKFSIYHLYHPEFTPTCSNAPRSCAIGLPLTSFEVEFSDSTPVTTLDSNYGTGLPCYVNCSVFHGTHTLVMGSYNITSQTDNADLREGDAFCFWYTLITPVALDTCGNTGYMLIFAQLDHGLQPDYRGWRNLFVQVVIWKIVNGFPSATIIATISGVSVPPMEEWIQNEWFTTSNEHHVLKTACGRSDNLLLRFKRT